MSLFASLLRDFRRTASDLPGLFSGHFCVMFLPLDPLLGDEATLPGYYSDQTYFCRLRETYTDPLAPYRCKKHLKNSCCVILELDGLGSFVFTNHRHSALFQNLQRRFPGVTSYVFCSDGPGA